MSDDRFASVESIVKNTWQIANCISSEHYLKISHDLLVYTGRPSAKPMMVYIVIEDPLDHELAEASYLTDIGENEFYLELFN